jgi:type IV secretory pathway TrbL component
MNLAISFLHMHEDNFRSHPLSLRLFSDIFSFVLSNFKEDNREIYDIFGQFGVQISILYRSSICYCPRMAIN